MNGGEAFWVARIDRVEGGLLAASGRAYDELHVGDVLVSTISPPHGGDRPAPFTIVGITTYGRAVPSLDRMLTGVLLLRGGDGCTPRPDALLVKEVPSQHEGTAHATGDGTGHRGDSASRT